MASSPQHLASTVQTVAILLAFGLILYMLSPPLGFWRLANGRFSSSACSSCMCNCLLESESMLLPGYRNTPTSDCDKVVEEVDQKHVDLLAEELKLQISTSEESQRRTDAALLEAKRLVSQYQKEAEKCSSGMETCEDARERSEAALVAQKKVSAMWERRARELGYRDKPSQKSLFDRLGLSGVGVDGQAELFLFRRQARRA